MKAATQEAVIAAKVSKGDLAMAAAGLAKDLEAVNQYAKCDMEADRIRARTRAYAPCSARS
jgi:hypothetical protein